MKTFCCEKFESYYSTGATKSESGSVIRHFPFIRIVKIQVNELSFRNRVYRYLFVTNMIENKFIFINMAYCPFCGENLYEYYYGDNFINDDSSFFF